jgi:hypothetical protein
MLLLGHIELGLTEISHSCKTIFEKEKSSK